jgi:oligopeptide/dipeptide ABC transporter ATP-binding protein
LQQISALKDELGFSILFITHDLSLMLEVCDTVGVLYAGRLCEVAPAKTLFSRPQHPYTQGLMGSFPSVAAARSRLLGIPGAPPDMRAPPGGCRFHPRCGQVLAECEVSTPLLTTLAPRHVAACFRAAPYVGTSSAAPPLVRESEQLIQQLADEDSGDRQTTPDLFVAAWSAESGLAEGVPTARPPHAVPVDSRELATAAAPAVSATASAPREGEA